MKTKDDAFGHAILDYFEGSNREEAASFGCRTWFSEYPDWSERERQAIAYAKGRILDVGCAAGRHSLYLQERGHDVLAIDNSPLAIRVCKKRGVQRAKVLRVTQLSRKLGSFDTILMFGNNFGLMGNLQRGQWLLRRLKGMTPLHGIILAGSGYSEDNQGPEFMGRVAENRRQGRLPGEFTLRPRYRNYVSPPIKWLYASKNDMITVLDGTGWQAKEFVDDDPPTSGFVALIQKDGQTSSASRRQRRHSSGAPLPG
jgi:SAM-dependent methyltransferase